MAFLGFSSILAVFLLFLQSGRLGASAAAAPLNGQPGYASGRVPILYEAYYPERREWSPQASLQEIQKLRDLTNQLLKEEEQLGQLAAAAAEASPENVYEPRGQILEYVFSRPAGALGGESAFAPVPVRPAMTRQSPASSDAENESQLASLTVTDTGRRRTRHHHGEANWLLGRLAAAPSPR